MEKVEVKGMKAVKIGVWTLVGLAVLDIAGKFGATGLALNGLKKFGINLFPENEEEEK